MDEEAFLGGNLSDAVRVGNTVRRRAGPWTPAVHALLRFLERERFDAAPRARGLDERGREVLEYVEGETHAGWPDPLPDWLLGEHCLVRSARLLRGYHDVVARFAPPPDGRWRLVAPTAHEIICHNDWSPWNAVFRSRRLAVMLDWDLAGPGTRIWDLANAAYVWVPLYSRAELFTLAERAGRLRVFCDSYGLADRSELLEVLRRRLIFVGDFIDEQARAGDPGFGKLSAWGIRAGMHRDAEYLDENREVFERALVLSPS